MTDIPEHKIIAAAKALYGYDRDQFFPVELRWRRLSVKQKFELLSEAYAALRAARDARKEQ